MPTLPRFPLRIKFNLETRNGVDSISNVASSSIWRGNDLSIEVAVFSLDAPLDLSNLASLTLQIKDKQNPTSDPLAEVEVLAAAITATITAEGYADGTAQNATFDFTSAQTNQTLNDAASRSFWLVLSGLTSDGKVITYGAVTLVINEDNAGTDVNPPPVPESSYYDTDEVDALLAANKVKTTVTSIAALAALNATPLNSNELVFVQGYYTAGDGGGGLFYLDKASSATANGGTIIAATVGRWFRLYEGKINVRWFGAKGDGGTEDTAAFQAAFNSVQGTYSTRDKGSVFIPKGVYIIGSTIQVNLAGTDYLTPAILGESVHSVTLKLKTGFTAGTALIRVEGGSPGVFWQRWGGFYIEGLGNGSDGGSDHIGIQIANLGGVNIDEVAFDKIKKCVQMEATSPSFAEFNVMTRCDFGNVTYWLEYVGNSSFHGSGLGYQCKGTVTGSQRCVKVTAVSGNPDIYNAPFNVQVFGDAATILWEHGGATAARLYGSITIECSAAITLGTGAVQTFTGFINTPNFNPNLGTFALVGAVGLTGLSYFPLLNSTTFDCTGQITGPTVRAPAATDMTLGTAVADIILKYGANAAASYIDMRGFAKSATGPTVASLLLKSLGVEEAIFAAGNGRFGGAASTPAAGTVVCAGDATFGGLIRGAGATYDVCLVNSVNAVVAGVPTGTQTFRAFGPISPSQSTVTWTAGTGSPEGVVTAPVGSIYSRTGGGAATSFYVKESGSGNTGWVAK